MKTFRLRYCAILLGIVASMASAATISGRVVAEDQDGQRAVDRVPFSLVEEPGKPSSKQFVVSLTDAEGRFRFDDVPPGSYRIKLSEGDKAFRVNGSFADYYLPMEGTLVEVKGPDIHDIAISAKSGATVTGRILDESGKPIPKAMVTSRFSTMRFGSVNSDGRFVMSGFKPGKEAHIHVLAMEERYAYVRVLTAEANELKPGSTSELGDFVWKPLPEKPNLRGTVRDAKGKLLEGRRNFQLDGVNEPIRILLLVRDGRFEQGVFPGSYNLAPASGRLEGRKPIQIVTVTETGVTDIDFTYDQQPPNSNRR